MRSRGFFNRGNTAFQQEDYPGAVEAYEEVLRMNPDDRDAKHNLELALLQMPPQGQDDQQEEEQDEQEEEEQQEEEMDEQEDEQDTETEEQDQPHNGDPGPPDTGIGGRSRSNPPGTPGTGPGLSQTAQRVRLVARVVASLSNTRRFLVVVAVVMAVIAAAAVSAVRAQAPPD